MQLRIVGVPEHFNMPLKMALEKYDEAVWKDVPGGSGAMRDMLKENECDVAIMLTDGAMVAIKNGLKASVHSVFVDSALIWGVHTSGKNEKPKLDEVDHYFLISRMGSGSHLMANVLADAQGWDKKGLKFEIVGTLAGAREAFKNRNSGLFMWEKYTTMPYVENGEMHCIGEVPTPWPAFVVVVGEKCSVEQKELLQNILIDAADIARESDQPSMVQLFSQRYGLPEARIQDWLKSTSWFGKAWNQELESVVVEQLRYYQLL